VHQKHPSKWPPAEEALADEFVSYFQLEALFYWERLTELCNSLGIYLSVTDLPGPLKGHNYRFGDNREILISTRQVLTKEHTALHELRELLEYEFRDLGTSICTNEDQEERAESFAVSVRICAFGKEIPGWMDQVGGIESKWPRRIAYGLLFAIIAIYALGIVISPLLEDIMEEERAKRPRLPK
jgi:hypothetical protein